MIYAPKKWILYYKNIVHCASAISYSVGLFLYIFPRKLWVLCIFMFVYIDQVFWRDGASLDVMV